MIRESAIQTLTATAVLLCLSIILVAATQTYADDKWDLIYSSANLTNHLINTECSPGDPTTNCPCTTNDIHLEILSDRARVTSNYRVTNGIWVNAIAGQRLWTFPNNAPIELDILKYKADVRIPVIPNIDNMQTQNAQAVQMLLQMWDGGNKVWVANSNAIEATIYWALNPWEAGYYENIYIYTDTTGALELVDTGIDLPVDTNWHEFEFTADIANRKWISVSIDSNLVDMSAIEIPLVYRPTWGTEVVYQVTQESCSTYPKPGYTNTFFWTTEFKDLELSKLNLNTECNSNAISNNFFNIEWESESFIKYQVEATEDFITWSNLYTTVTGDGTKQAISLPINSSKEMYYKLKVEP